MSEATGACHRGLEKFLKVHQLPCVKVNPKQARRLIKLTAIAARAACTIMHLVRARDGRSRQDAKMVFSPPEIETLDAILPEPEGKTALRRNPHPPETLASAAWIIARPDGWDGYLKSKPPGLITFRQGL